MENEIKQLALIAYPPKYIREVGAGKVDVAIYARHIWIEGYEAAQSKNSLGLIKDFVGQLRSHVNHMQSRPDNDELADKYYSGQDLICAMVLQEIEKYQ